MSIPGVEKGISNMLKQQAVINYDDLAAEYNDGLVMTLRGSGIHRGYLELWVPSPDPLQSIVSLIDAASAGGESGVSIVIKPGTAQTLDTAALRAAAGRFGSVRLSTDAAGLTLEVSNLAGEAGAAGILADVAGSNGARRTAEVARSLAAIGQSVPPAPGQPVELPVLYRDAVQAAADRPLPPAGTGLAVSATVDGLTLTLIVDPASAMIVGAGFEGARTPLVRGLLTAACGLLPGLPVDEAADHGTVRLEQALRAPAARPPLAGVLIPRAISPAFGFVEALVRAAADSFRAATGFLPRLNEFDQPPSAAWLALDDAGRKARLEQAIAALGAEGGQNLDGVGVEAVEHDVRVVVSLPDGMAGNDKQTLLMRLDRGIKDRVDRRLEVFQGELKDRNKQRHRD